MDPIINNKGASCPVLPDSVQVREVLVAKALADLKITIAQDLLPADRIKLGIAKLASVHQEKLCSDLLFHLLLVDLPAGHSSKAQFLAVLSACPTAAQLPDARGMLLVHHLLSSDDYDPELLFRLIMACPESVLAVNPADQHGMNCLQMALTKCDIDLKMVYAMLSHCPAAASVPLESGKLPLHLLLGHNAMLHQHEAYYAHVLKKLLFLHPRAAFIQITEEQRTMRPGTPTTQQPTTEEGQQRTASDDERIVYTMQVSTVTWCPMERARASADPQVPTVLSILSY